MFAVDFLDEAVVEWHRTEDGVRTVEREDYHPTIYVAGPAEARVDLREALDADPKVVETMMVHDQWHLDLHAAEPEPVLRIDCARVDEVRTLAREIRHHHERGSYPPGTLRLFNVDLAPGFRYCVETGTSPVPAHDLRSLRVGLDEKSLADGEVDSLHVEGEPAGEHADAALRTLARRLDRVDPDVLLLSHGDLVPLLYEAASDHDVDLELGRRPGWTRLAGSNTYESYGRVGHSPARYDVPGRAIVATNNSFLWHESSLAGLEYMVERSWRPIQETGWASIGTVLTAMQTREALSRGVLVPWNKWEPETFKDARTLHAADRGGVTLSPEVGLHEDVHELDFASLYPNVICRHNISPETVGCACHADREDVPTLGYSICDEPGFLPDVLQPLLDDRAELKRRIRAADTDADTSEPESISAAIKWVLVSCFGYQGYRNAKFGRIECHEAINAVARDVFMEAKRILEAGGWRVVHGIVDSLWVTACEGREQAPLDELAAEISDRAGITLEHEAAYDWVCFVPRRGTQAGALMKYFGKSEDGDYKLRGVEARQRSTPDWIDDLQRDLLAVLDEHREPEPVVDRLRVWLCDLRAGRVDPADLVISKRVGKRLADYDQRTHTVAALQRYDRHGVDRHPGQPVNYVVVADAARNAERVRLDFEACTDYDADYYADLAMRATESIVSPLGWDRDDITNYLHERRDAALSAFL
ncbi:type B DNA-directed DNA polymerase [Haloarchaeobius sp. DYHT-AS-18]|uniref:type B DNA-directed DNA polymerase n=1 Tax=Haloarchaeobius sp. DYHT-AS-18 TaxID=3446117 RepID=UPI003EBA19AE